MFASLKLRKNKQVEHCVDRVDVRTMAVRQISEIEKSSFKCGKRFFANRFPKRGSDSGDIKSNTYKIYVLKNATNTEK
jgi:hypothetical protein